MNRTFLLALYSLLLVSKAYPQGAFQFNSIWAPTRIGSIDGPPAGSGIWAQMLAGLTADSLTPMGMPAQHLDSGGAGTGLVFGGVIRMPGLLPGETAFAKMLAWDGTRWGNVLSDVPADQLGMTDIVPVLLEDPNFGTVTFAPHFTQPAIVPIPEPSILALGISGGVSLFLLRRIRHFWKCSPD